MKTLKQLAIVLTGIFLFASCQKEMSFETSGNFAGILMADSNGCFTVKSVGQYIRDSTLDGTSYVKVPIVVQSPGLYNITTNQVNGFYFADSGFLVNPGIDTLILKAVGTPIASMITHFDLTFNGIESCSFNVKVTDSAVYYATYTLKDATGNCRGDSLEGQYYEGVALNSTNILTVDVNVLNPGLYAIKTASTNGMTFSTSGTFFNTGIQTVILTATGTPLVPGSTNMVLEGDTDDSAKCNFVVTVMKVDYFPTTTNSFWTYGTTLTTDSTVVTVLSATKLINSLTYSQFLSVSAVTGIDTFFYRKVSHNYYEYGSFGNNAVPPPLNIYDTVIGAADYAFLKDTAVNATWDSPELVAADGGVPGKAKVKFTIAARNQNIMVGPLSAQVTIGNVIKVHRDYQFAPNPGTAFSSIATADFYYARDNGLLLVEFNVSPLPLVKVSATRWKVF